MHPSVDALFADPAAPDPNDMFELSWEVDGPQPDTRRGGFRGTWFIPAADRRVPVEGYFQVVKAGVW